ncbi:MAG: DinB family protein [Vicinamibacterales bacterium]
MAMDIEMPTGSDRTRRAFVVDEAAALLARTPPALDALLRDLPDGWIVAHEGGETWSPFDVVGHLIHAERTNWIPRARMILEQGEARAFDDFDRFAQLASSRGRTLADLLDEFAAVRQESLRELAGLAPADFDRRGRHPALGAVTLRQLLAAWVVHDLDHLMQVARIMAGQYSDEVGPWRRYLRIVRDTPD